MAEGSDGNDNSSSNHNSNQLVNSNPSGNPLESMDGFAAAGQPGESINGPAALDGIQADADGSRFGQGESNGLLDPNSDADAVAAYAAQAIAGVAQSMRGGEEQQAQEQQQQEEEEEEDEIQDPNLKLLLSLGDTGNSFLAGEENQEDGIEKSQTEMDPSHSENQEFNNNQRTSDQDTIMNGLQDQGQTLGNQKDATEENGNGFEDEDDQEDDGMDLEIQKGVGDLLANLSKNMNVDQTQDEEAFQDRTTSLRTIEQGAGGSSIASTTSALQAAFNQAGSSSNQVETSNALKTSSSLSSAALTSSSNAASTSILTATPDASGPNGTLAPPSSNTVDEFQDFLRSSPDRRVEPQSNQEQDKSQDQDAEMDLDAAIQMALAGALAQVAQGEDGEAEMDEDQAAVNDLARRDAADQDDEDSVAAHIASITRAATGLDSMGNPLPGNEQSHQKLSEVVKRLSMNDHPSSSNAKEQMSNAGLNLTSISERAQEDARRFGNEEGMGIRESDLEEYNRQVALALGQAADEDPLDEDIIRGSRSPSPSTSNDSYRPPGGVKAPGEARASSSRRRRSNADSATATPTAPAAATTTNTTTASTTTAGAAPGAPVKRGRGRPPKYPRVESVQSEATPASASASTPTSTSTSGDLSAYRPAGADQAPRGYQSDSAKPPVTSLPSTPKLKKVIQSGTKSRPQSRAIYVIDSGTDSEVDELDNDNEKENIAGEKGDEEDEDEDSGSEVDDPDKDLAKPPVRRGKRGKGFKGAAKEKIKKHICPICKVGFARAFNLRTHKSTHSDELSKHKPHTCPYPACKEVEPGGRHFSRKHDLQRHIASTHTGEDEPGYFGDTIQEAIERRQKEGIPDDYNEKHEGFDPDNPTGGLGSLGKGFDAPSAKIDCQGCGKSFVRRDAYDRHRCSGKGERPPKRKAPSTSSATPKPTRKRARSYSSASSSTPPPSATAPSEPPAPRTNPTRTSSRVPKPAPPPAPTTMTVVPPPKPRRRRREIPGENEKASWTADGTGTTQQPGSNLNNTNTNSAGDEGATPQPQGAPIMPASDFDPASLGLPSSPEPQPLASNVEELQSNLNNALGLDGNGDGNENSMDLNSVPDLQNLANQEGLDESVRSIISQLLAQKGDRDQEQDQEEEQDQEQEQEQDQEQEQAQEDFQEDEVDLDHRAEPYFFRLPPPPPPPAAAASGDAAQAQQEPESMQDAEGSDSLADLVQRTLAAAQATFDDESNENQDQEGGGDLDMTMESITASGKVGEGEAEQEPKDRSDAAERMDVDEAPIEGA